MSDQRAADIAFLKASGQFDADWYLAQYPDVAQIDMDPVEHYVRFGVLMRRNPSTRFDTAFYLSRYPDVRKAGANPLVHYLRHGSREGRQNLPDRSISLVKKARTAPATPPARRRSAKAASTSEIATRSVRLLDNPSILAPAGIDDSLARQFREWDAGQEQAFLDDLAALYARDAARYDAIAVSIVMPLYNRAFCVTAAVESVLRQSHGRWQLILVDDGSTDDTVNVLQRFVGDPRVRLVRQENRGVSAARNRGLQEVTGDYVFYLDSDNVWDERLLRTLLVYMEAGGLDAAYCGLRAIDDQRRTVFWRGDLFSWPQCLIRNYIDLNTFAHRRALLERTGERFDPALRRLVDWDFILRVTAAGRVSFAPFAGVTYYHGEMGSRISLTEYVGDELALYERRIRAKHDGRPSDARDALAWLAIRERYALAGPRPRLRFSPDYRASNPYQQALYAGFEGFDVAPGSLRDCIALAEQGSEPVIFHLHWTNPIYASAATEAEAGQLVDAFIADAGRLRALGGRILWTLHNVVSHESKYREQELRLARALCELAEHIHVHHAASASLAAAYFAIPAEKLVVAPHGSYIGLLPDERSRAEARERLGIPADATVFVMFGQLRAYKGLESLIEAFERVRASHPSAWLVIAGKPLQIDVRALQARVASLPNVILHPGFVPDAAVQDYLRAADAAVLPYRNVLTSGSVHLALSFDLPVIAPRRGLLEHTIDHERNGLLYDDDDGLFAAMQTYAELPEARRLALAAAARDAARAQTWSQTSSKLVRYLQGPSFGRKLRLDVGGLARTMFVRDGATPLAGAQCAAIVLHYRNLQDTFNCGQSVLAQEGPIALVIVSNSESLDDARRLAAAFPQATVVQADDNLGYAGGNNLGLALAREAGCAYFWILNPDVIVPDGYYRALLQQADAHPTRSFFGSVATYGADSGKVWFGGGDLDDSGFSTHRHAGAALSELPSQPYECDYLTGANIFARMPVLDRVGYIPEEYFLYFEETDWFMRARAAGERPLVFPDLRVAHMKRSEGGGVPTREYVYYFVRNARLFGQRYVPDQAKARDRRLEEFERAWLAKIAERAPARLAEFQRLFERAHDDGRRGVTGRALL